MYVKYRNKLYTFKMIIVSKVQGWVRLSLHLDVYVS